MNGEASLNQAQENVTKCTQLWEVQNDVESNLKHTPKENVKNDFIVNTQRKSDYMTIGQCK